MFRLSSGFAQVFSCGPFVSPCFPLKNWEIASWHLHEFSGGCDSVRVAAWSLGWENDSVHMENVGYIMAPLRSLVGKGRKEFKNLSVILVVFWIICF